MRDPTGDCHCNCAALAYMSLCAMGVTTQTFDILTRLAIGNGALVYRAVDKTSLRQVALKLLTQDGEVDHKLDLEALFADAPRIKGIAGSHVCQLLDAFADDDGPVLVYEYANGLNGSEFPTQRKLDAAQALDVAAQVISALRSGERQRMPHGDVKPSNLIFVDLPDGRPFTFVLDWGLAAYRQAMPEDSLFYLAPERLSGQPATHVADLFSAGATLFYLYTGKVLVAGGTKEQVAAAWQGVRPAVLAELRPDLPAKLVQWVNSLLELDPAKRPASAVEAATALAALNPPPPAVAPESIRPRPVAPAPQASRVVAPPASSVRSGIRPAPVMPVVPTMRQVTPAAKKKKLLPILLVVALSAGAIGGGTYYYIKSRDRGEVDLSPAPVLADTRSREESAGPGENGGKVASVAAAPATPPSATAESGFDPTKPPASALIAFESFENPGGAKGTNIVAANGGRGWAEAWTGAPAKIDGSSLLAANYRQAGASFNIGRQTTDLSWARAVGPAARFFPTPGKPSHWYFSILVSHNSGAPEPGGTLVINPFSSLDINNVVRITIKNEGKAYKVTLNDLPPGYTFSESRDPILLILRVEATPNNGRYDLQTKLWVSPDLPSTVVPEKFLACNLKAVILPPKMGIRILKGKGPARTRVDEIRYGWHWADVTMANASKIND